ncbi:MAG: hypothetical protein ACTSRZ_12790 [Promethearchaeota archaeon]
MNSTMHATVSWFIYNILYWSIFKIPPTPLGCFLAFLFGILPDFDGIYFSIKNKKASHGTEFQHHLNSWFHWPICWFPLIIVFILSLIFKFYPEYFITPMLGVYLHMILDSAGCGDGMMWFHGFHKTDFARYINFWSKKTDGYHGNYWSARYRKTIFFKIENFNGVVVILLSIWYMILEDRFVFLHFLVILATISFMIVGIIGPDEKYTREPPEGRYADYRKNKLYLEWMKKKGYIFNERMQPVKKKMKKK